MPGNQPTGQMYGGYYVGDPPDERDNWTRYYHNGALYSDPRISAYVGCGYARCRATCGGGAGVSCRRRRRSPTARRPTQTSRGRVSGQSMIMAVLDNALEQRAMQRHFAADPVSWAVRTYLSLERLSIG